MYATPKHPDTHAQSVVLFIIVMLIAVLSLFIAANRPADHSIKVIPASGLEGLTFKLSPSQRATVGGEVLIH